jgi:hypothetical protein
MYIAMVAVTTFTVGLISITTASVAAFNPTRSRRITTGSGSISKLNLQLVQQRPGFRQGNCFSTSPFVVATRTLGGLATNNITPQHYHIATATAACRPDTYLLGSSSSSSPSDDDETTEPNTNNDSQVKDDLLMCINFHVREKLFDADADARLILVSRLQKYVQGFPYAAVLPVQPLHYVPSEHGVTVKFLRKKTKEKDGQDGGIQIDVLVTAAKEQQPQQSSKEDDDDEDDDDFEDDDTTSSNDTAASATTIEVMVKRVSKGQTVSKIFSEKLIVMQLLEGIKMTFANNEDGENDQPQLDMASVYHKWM